MRIRTRRQVRFKTFPPYLVVQMQRFFIAADWTMKKRDVLVPAPDVLDLEPLRAQGLQPGEVLLPEDAPVAAVAAAAAPRPVTSRPLALTQADCTPWGVALLVDGALLDRVLTHGDHR